MKNTLVLNSFACQSLGDQNGKFCLVSGEHVGTLFREKCENKWPLNRGGVASKKICVYNWTYVGNTKEKLALFKTNCDSQKHVLGSINCELSVQCCMEPVHGYSY